MSAHRRRKGAPPPDDTARAATAAAILGVLFAIAAAGLYGGRAAVSVLLGAAIAVANLLTMRAIIRALLQAPEDADAGASDAPADDEAPKDHAGAGRRGGVAWGIFAALKIVLLFGGIWFLLTRNLVDPMPLVVGYGVLPLGICLGSLWSNLRPR